MIFALDGNINTFWHSQWKGAQPLPPHYFTIDMGESKDMLGAAFVARQNVSSGRPQDIQLLVSDDNTNWKPAWSGVLANTGDLQKIFFSTSIKGRYVKFQVDDSYSSNFTHLAEFYLF